MSILTIIITVLLSVATAAPRDAIIPEREIPREIYADCGAILEDPSETVTITMQNGNQFSFSNDGDDWMKGDLVAVVFDNSGTEEVFDDIIISCRYCGWIEENEQENWVK